MAEEKERKVAAEAQAVEQPSLLEEIVQATKLKPSDEAYSITRRGVEALISQLLEPGREVAKISKAVLDDMIAAIDKKLSLQLDAILHQEGFQKLESA
jgi:type VI secretion system protein ImpC